MAERPPIVLDLDSIIYVFRGCALHIAHSLLGDHSGLEPPDPIPNSEVKRISADGSVGSPHVRVGHRQAFIKRRSPGRESAGAFLFDKFLTR